jgi:hypothetical protein
MKVNSLFWLLWGLSLVFLIVVLISGITIDKIFFLFVQCLLGIVFYSQRKTETSIEKILDRVEKINLKSVEDEIKKVNEQQTECLLKAFNLEMNLENYKIEQEKKYRDIARKVLEVDNKVNEKFELLGKVMLKLSKDSKKS